MQVDLVNASDGVQLWGGRFARPAGEGQSLAGTIVEQITQRLRPRLSDDERERLARRHTLSPEAYVLYLRGRYALVQYTGPKLRQSIESFQQALARVPNLAAGWAGMAVAGSLPNARAARNAAAIKIVFQLNRTAGLMSIPTETRN